MASPVQIRLILTSTQNCDPAGILSTRIGNDLKKNGYVAVGAILMREGPNGRKKLVGQGPKTKLAESQFLKRNICHSVKMK